MGRKIKIQLLWGLSLFSLFVLYTVSLTFVGMEPVGPQGSFVAYANFNQWFHEICGVHWVLYCITDWAGVTAIFVALGFAVLGLVQWIKRKKIRKVDSSILLLGVFYLVVFGTYVFFEYCEINYRPVLINGILETSYPSSTTMLALCVFPTAMMQFNRRIKNTALRNAVNVFCGLFTAFMVLVRLVCGVHWFTDILGGVFFSTAVVLLYSASIYYVEYKYHGK